MKVTCKKTGKDMTSKVIKAIEKSLIKDGYTIKNVYTSDPEIRKGYENSNQKIKTKWTVDSSMQ